MERIALVITEEDVKHRLQMWNLPFWRFEYTKESKTLIFRCHHDLVRSDALNNIWEAFKPEEMTVTKSDRDLKVDIHWNKS